MIHESLLHKIHEVNTSLLAWKYKGYRISSNRMRALYLFHYFESVYIIQGRFVFEGALYFLPINLMQKFYYEISNRTQ